MSKETRKWMPMFWSDYFRGTQQFTNATEHGAYLLLLAYCWNKGALPPDDDMRRRIAKCTHRQWRLIRNLMETKFDSEGRNERCDIELTYAIEKSKTLSANAKHRYNKSKSNADTPTPTPTKNKSEISKIDKNGYIANPGSEEFKTWKDWAFVHQTALWRELQKREFEGRSFSFESQWPK